ncbi:MAG: RNA polymerase sigma-70 factor [Saprospiraceae bacterium]
MTDRELWEGIQNGKEEAFKQLFYRHHPAMVQVAYTFLQDESQAKDIAQDVFVRLWIKRRELQIQGECKPYLLAAIRNRCINELKRKKTLAFDVTMEKAQTGNTPQDNLQVEDLERAINRIILRLPDACRTIFLMRRMEHLSLKEIATQLEISPKTVENQLTKAQKILAVSLKPLLLVIWILLHLNDWP